MRIILGGEILHSMRTDAECKWPVHASKSCAKPIDRMVLTFQSPKSDNPNKPHIFRSYDNLHRLTNQELRRYDRNPGQAHQVEIWRIARATSAAPSYFKPPEIEGVEYCDGGFGANNPCHELHLELQSMSNQAKDCTNVMLSVGTGMDKPMSRLAGKGIDRYLNFVNFATKLVTTPEMVHEAMHLESTMADPRIFYYRLNVEKGLSTMELDEWRTRGSFRLKLGRCIGRLRSKKSAHPRNGDILSGSEKRQNQAFVHSSGADVEPSPEASIPPWFRPKNRTLEAIREHTEAYLDQAEVTERINDCAHRLVKIRRERVKNNPQKWAKVCASICYQCGVTGCPRGSHKYTERRHLRRHLTDKHKDIYSKRREHAEVLESFLDDCKIEFH